MENIKSISHNYTLTTEKVESMTPRKTSSSKVQLETTPISMKRQPLAVVSASRLNREATGSLLSSGAVRVPNKASPLVQKKGGNNNTPQGSASKKSLTSANNSNGHAGYMQATVSASCHRLQGPVVSQSSPARTPSRPKARRDADSSKEAKNSVVHHKTPTQDSATSPMREDSITSHPTDIAPLRKTLFSPTTRPVPLNVTPSSSSKKIVDKSVADSKSPYLQSPYRLKTQATTHSPANRSKKPSTPKSSISKSPAGQASGNTASVRPRSQSAGHVRGNSSAEKSQRSALQTKPSSAAFRDLKENFVQATDLNYQAAPTLTSQQSSISESSSSRLGASTHKVRNNATSSAFIDPRDMGGSASISSSVVSSSAMSYPAETGIRQVEGATKTVRREAVVQVPVSRNYSSHKPFVAEAPLLFSPIPNVSPVVALMSTGDKVTATAGAVVVGGGSFCLDDSEGRLSTISAIVKSTSANLPSFLDETISLQSQMRRNSSSPEYRDDRSLSKQVSAELDDCQVEDVLDDDRNFKTNKSIDDDGDYVMNDDLTVTSDLTNFTADFAIPVPRRAAQDAAPEAMTYFRPSLKIDTVTSNGGQGVRRGQQSTVLSARSLTSGSNNNNFSNSNGVWMDGISPLSAVGTPFSAYSFTPRNSALLRMPSVSSVEDGNNNSISNGSDALNNAMRLSDQSAIMLMRSLLMNPTPPPPPLPPAFAFSAVPTTDVSTSSVFNGANKGSTVLDHSDSQPAINASFSSEASSDSCLSEARAALPPHPMQHRSSAPLSSSVITRTPPRENDLSSRPSSQVRGEMSDPVARSFISMATPPMSNNTMAAFISSPDI